MNEPRIEILNPMHPVTEKLTIFVTRYLRTCLTEQELQVIGDRFDAILDLLTRIIESNSGKQLDNMIGMWAGILAGKWKLPYGTTMMAMVLIETQLKNLARRK